MTTALDAVLRGLRSSGLHAVTLTDIPGGGEIVIVAVLPADVLTAPTGWPELSERGRTVARHVRKGLTNQQIATRMGISKHTVNYHLRRIYQKLGIASRVELATYEIPE
ncbi:response regulator transcription factor [Dactylosporangium sp. CA-233914]|uniref:response regulator transcription factor n=1 Tax=Dactylosporangium sp. CA-233914 TaxID=3239934 RepID=UPI003D94A35A